MWVECTWLSGISQLWIFKNMPTSSCQLCFYVYTQRVTVFCSAVWIGNKIADCVLKRTFAKYILLSICILTDIGWNVCLIGSNVVYMYFFQMKFFSNSFSSDLTKVNEFQSYSKLAKSDIKYLTCPSVMSVCVTGVNQLDLLLGITMWHWKYKLKYMT